MAFQKGPGLGWSHNYRKGVLQSESHGRLRAVEEEAMKRLPCTIYSMAYPRTPS